MLIKTLAVSAAIMAAGLYAMDAMADDREKLQDAYDAIESLEDASALEDPADIMTWIDMPRAVDLGKTFDITVIVENGRADRPLKMNAVDINDDLLAGIEVIAVTPEPRSADHYADGYVRLEYPIDIEPGNTWQVVISVRARQSGVFIDDIDIVEGQRFLSRSAQIRIR